MAMYGYCLILPEIECKHQDKVKTSDKKLDNDDKVLTANTVNSFQRAWATPERANNVPHFLLHHDYFNLLRGACAQH